MSLITANDARSIEKKEITTLEELAIYASKQINIAASRGFTQVCIAVNYPVTLEDKTLVEIMFKEKGYFLMWIDKKTSFTFDICWKRETCALYKLPNSQEKENEKIEKML